MSYYNHEIIYQLHFLSQFFYYRQDQYCYLKENMLIFNYVCMYYENIAPVQSLYSSLKGVLIFSIYLILEFICTNYLFLLLNCFFLF